MKETFYPPVEKPEIVPHPTRNIWKGQYKPPIIFIRHDVPEWSKRTDFTLKTLAE